MIQILKDKISKLEILRSSLNKTIQDAEREYKKEAYINGLYGSYEKVIYALNVLYGIEKDMEIYLIEKVV